MKILLPAALLIASVVGMTSCVDPMPTPPPPGPRGRSLDMPPRYGAGESQTRYFEGTQPPPVSADPNAAATVQTPDPNAAPPIPGSSTTTTTTTVVPPTPPVVVTPPAPVTPAPAADIPFASRMPGKPGFVKSPFDPNGQAIDVRDFQSGQKARCPYTGKIFRVP